MSKLNQRSAYYALSVYCLYILQQIYNHKVINNLISYCHIMLACD